MRFRKIAGMFIALLILAISAVPVSAANGEDAGENGTAGVSAADHVIVNQVMGASGDGAASHSFIELYNPTGSDVSLDGWSVQYRSSESGAHSDSWNVLTLEGTVKAGGYFLIRCGAVDPGESPAYDVPAGDMEWDMQLHNKGLSVALMENTTQLDDDFTGNIMDENFTKPDGFVDLAAARGNDGEENQIPPAWEGSYSDIQSKKKAIRRTDFADTNDNAADFAAVDYRETVSSELGPHTGSDDQPDGEGSGGGEGNEDSSGDTPSFTAADTTSEKYYGYFNDDTATLDIELAARYNSGASSGDGGSAEITAYNSSNGYAYSVNGLKGTLDCFSMQTVDGGNRIKDLPGSEIDIAAMIENGSGGSDFSYGDMTSVAVSPDGKLLAVALQSSDYTANGKVAVFDCGQDGGLTNMRLADAGVQPDMITFSSDGTAILTANEGEPRKGYSAADATDPAGSVTIIDTDSVIKGTPSSENIGFDSFDDRRSDLIADGIVIRKDTAPSVDFEPEYITVAGSTAYVTLQEANAIAVLDLGKREFTGVYSAGFEDHSKIAIDLNKGDETYAPDTYENIMGIRMPDGISSCVIDGQTYLLTANEGDGRAWPADTEADTNEIEDKKSPVCGTEFDKKVTWFDTAQYDGLREGTDYLFGGRSFTMFRVTGSGLEEVFDSGCDFEEKTSITVIDNFNCSNDDITIDDRSGKKGPEPETVTTGTIGGRTYAFVGLERVSGIMVYDITDPDDVKFDNYINSRDFSENVKNDVSPEGLCFVSAQSRSAKAPLLLSSNEVSGTVSVMKLTPAGSENDDTAAEEIVTGNDSSSDTNTPDGENSIVETPDTGDDPHIMFWLTLVLISGAMIAATIIYRLRSVSSK